jgi:myo-inositol 2-dehydrogenase / D-chiro-inositol 1-dehydrogenase
VSAVRLALVGVGDIARRGHLPALAASGGAELVAAVDADPARLDAPELPRGITRTARLEDVLADDGIDAVVVATPVDATPAIAVAALAAGKYVLAEKPPAPTLAEARAVAAAPGADERLAIGLTYRHHPAIDRLRALIADGALGRPLLIRNTISDEPADRDGDPEGYARRLAALGRAAPIVLDGVHACDRLNLLLGEEPADVAGWSLRTSHEYALPNVNGAVLGYADGTVARLEVIWLLPVLPPPAFTVAGPDGLAVLDPPTFALRVERADGSVEELPPPGDKTATCFALQLERFLAAVRAGRPPVPGIAEALASLELAERCAVAAGAATAIVP